MRLFSLLLVCTTSLLATSPAEPHTSPPCDTPSATALRSWLGRWYIATADGRLQGETVVQSLADGCAILERWHGTSGGNGYSLSAWDRQTDAWRYLFANDTGIVLTAEGRVRGDSLRWRVLSFSEPRDTLEETWTWSLRPPIVHRGQVEGNHPFAWSFRYTQWNDSLPPVSRHNGPCAEDPERHSLDHLLGTHSLRDRQGALLGVSTRTSILDACALFENITLTAGGSAIRLLTWDPLARAWRQLSTDSRGRASLQTLTTTAATAWQPTTG